MQAFIVLVTMIAASQTHDWTQAAVIFATMQLGAIIGTHWGVQLSNKFRRVAS
jgi:hypothetical protein